MAYHFREMYDSVGFSSIFTASAVHVMACPSVASRSSVEVAERIALGFWHGNFHQSCNVSCENSAISKNKSTSPWNFVPNSGLGKFCHGESKRGVVNETRRRSSLWTAPVTVDALRPHARSLLRARRSIRVYSLWSMKRKPISPTSG